MARLSATIASSRRSPPAQWVSFTVLVTSSLTETSPSRCPSGTLSSDDARKYFRREAMALAKLNHPHVETIYDFGTQDGVDFLVMEYVPGKTLADRLSGGALPEKEVIELGIQIASGVEEAHERGIVHRDLKPANIAVTAKGYAKILDFGLARLLRPREEGATEVISDSHAVAGTVPYMPPEQLRGESVDGRADIYTIGAVLYEMCASWNFLS